MKTFNTQETVTVNNYPYGRLQCEATFGIEFKASKGFRTIFQTVNPKTGRVNAAKYGVYQNLLLMVQYEESDGVPEKVGHVSYLHGQFYGVKETNAALKLVADNFECYTEDQIEFFYSVFIAWTRSTVRWSGNKAEAVLEYFKPFIEIAIMGIKTKVNGFTKLVLDEEVLKAIKEEKDGE